ncbi:hypothetical protein GCM10010401_09760 [Rarobacter faecitabidus]
MDEPSASPRERDTGGGDARNKRGLAAAPGLLRFHLAGACGISANFGICEYGGVGKVRAPLVSAACGPRLLLRRGHRGGRLGDAR